jgi:BirA family biotin operon repressor/biotin-[acetyl-CoA-carboxylase] ligase
VAIGFGVVLALRDLVLPAGLKWPNDILVGGRKVGGILVEGRSEGGCLKTAVAGVGVNWLAPDTSGEPPLTPPTGLAAELAATGTNIPSPERVLGSLLEHMEQAYLLLRSAGPAPFSAAWPRVSAHLGRPVVVQDPGPTSTPALAGPLLPDGSLEVVTAGGERRRLVSAEVRLRLTP